MESVLWACMVHEPDAKWLAPYLAAIGKQETQPNHVVVIDSSASEVIRRVVSAETNLSVAYEPMDENLGFNASLNRAIKLAVDRRVEWIATMTVRAIPQPAWLANALAVTNAKTGMVTTLHLNEKDSLDCLGHMLGPEGQLFAYAENLRVADIERLPKLANGELPIWSPCSGGALYRTSAFLQALSFCREQHLVRERGFKSYNCDVLGYMVRSVGGHNAYALNAVCTRDRTDSSSKNPSTAGLVMNQEINRIANLFEFWEPLRRTKAIARYLQHCRPAADLQPIDLLIARTLGEGIARTHLYRTVGAQIQAHLDEYLSCYEETKETRKHLLSRHE